MQLPRDWITQIITNIWFFISIEESFLGNIGCQEVRVSTVADWSAPPQQVSGFKALCAITTCCTGSKSDMYVNLFVCKHPYTYPSIG